MPRKRRAAREFQRKHKPLTPGQEGELLVGPFGQPAFANDAARRQAWAAHRDALMRMLPPDGRGWTWVTFQGGGFHPSDGGRITKALARIDQGNPNAAA
jgi:hypothetical protein